MSLMQTDSDNRRPNRLAKEKSPYLLQHAFNPVEWYPWGEEAFAKARDERKPIFLSIGYSTCHWCHVMERESFEDASIAALLNEFFVSIKVDREERPDVDKVYMTALQAMGQNGGWPMSMFLTPEREPFYGGTYFPPESRHGRAGFPDVLKRIHEIWTTEQGKALESARDITAFLREASIAGGGSSGAPAGVQELCFNQISSTYDRKFGGFGDGPKFPRPAVFNFLLRYHARTGNPIPLEMVAQTLRAMASGGIYDQLGGGFHRYSVDGRWRVPHFEKMLYDQAQLVQTYLEAFQLTGDPLFSTVAGETLDYVLRDMVTPEGGFTSAEDADSPRYDNPRESGEGAFYVWTRNEVMTLLGADGSFVCDHFGVEEEGNAPSDPQQEFIGQNILYRARPGQAAGTASATTGDDLRLSEGKKKLLAARGKRPRPPRDDKVLTSWNGLMIGACARGWRVLGQESYGRAARTSAEFIMANLYDPFSGLLLHRYREGEAGVEAHLDDYAFLVSGLLDLYEASGDGAWLTHATRLTEKQVELFADPVRGGFYDTSGKDATVLVRMKEQYDGAEPAGNSVAAMNLIRLSRTIDRPDWGTMAERTIAQFSDLLGKQPVMLPQMVAAMGAPPRHIVIAGDPGTPGVAELIAVLFGRFLSDAVVMYIPSGGSGEFTPFIRSLPASSGEPAAYVCRDFTCELPVHDAPSLAALLDRPRS